MNPQSRFVPKGTITTPRGFRAGAVAAGLKAPMSASRLDLGLLYSERPCAAAGLFTTNKVQAAPVLVSREHLRHGMARAIAANSGGANAVTGARGLADAREMAALAAARLGLAPSEVLVASTGVIGVRLPMERLRAGLARITLSRRGGGKLARAILTTDRGPKEAAVSFPLGGETVTIGGIAKGAGMIHPHLATLLCFLATDAAVSPPLLQGALRDAADVSFNLLSIDGDTSTNDSVFLLASGAAGAPPITGGFAEQVFRSALERLCVHLAREVARGGEGASRLIEVTVEGARTQEEARAAARAIASSNLVKTAVYGADPNWGRVLAAAGRSGADLAPERASLYLGDVCLLRGGEPLPFDHEAARALLRGDEVAWRLELALGPGRAVAWGCDLSPEYVNINSSYTS